MTFPSVRTMFSRSKRPAARPRRMTVRPALELLEDRRVPSVATVIDGHVLRLQGDDRANRIAITDDGRGDVAVALDGDVPRTFHGIDRIQVMAGGGDDVVTVFCPDDNTRPADLFVDLGRGNDRFTLLARPGEAVPPSTHPWSIHILGGAGDDQVRTNIQGSVPVRMAVDLGGGNDFADVAIQDVEQMPLPDTLTIDGGMGNDVIRVSYTFNLQPESPGFVEAPISTNIDGGMGNDDIRVLYAFNPQPEPPRVLGFNIPLFTQITGGEGADDIRVLYEFNPQPPGFPGIVLNAPILLGVDSGSENDTIGVTFGQASTPERPSPPPVLNNLFLMRLDGGAGNDTFTVDLAFSARSRGFLDAQILGGRGNDDLTLNVYGLDNPDFIRALIDGGPGIDTAHHTANVMVRNVER